MESVIERQMKWISRCDLACEVERFDPLGQNQSDGGEWKHDCLSFKIWTRGGEKAARETSMARRRCIIEKSEKGY